MAEELRVCLHELLGNIVMHAGPAVSFMRVSASNEPEGVALTVEDDGRPFDPTTQPSRRCRRRSMPHRSAAWGWCSCADLPTSSLTEGSNVVIT